jgi:hypothetical protein
MNEVKCEKCGSADVRWEICITRTREPTYKCFDCGHAMYLNQAVPNGFQDLPGLPELTGLAEPIWPSETFFEGQTIKMVEIDNTEVTACFKTGLVKLINHTRRKAWQFRLPEIDYEEAIE